MKQVFQSCLASISSLIRHAQILRRKLGLTVWRGFSEDMKEGIKKLKDSLMYQKVEETLNESMNELTNLIISGDNFMIKTVEKVEVGVEKAIVIASEELQMATRKTSDGFLNAQRKASQSLQKLGIVDPPKLYRKEEMPAVIEEA